jgi:hypothetical protein
MMGCIPGIGSAHLVVFNTTVVLLRYDAVRLGHFQYDSP